MSRSLSCRGQEGEVLAINRINQTHIPQIDKAHTLSATKTQNATPSANTAAKESQGGETHGTTVAAAAKNYAGREQGNRQNTDESSSKGTLVNVHA